jgi:hypothetical protein
MSVAQRTDYRARAAESLERARQTRDEDLRGLYATIAKQWQLLAEDSEMRRPCVLGSFPKQSIPIAEADHDLIAQTTPDFVFESTSLEAINRLDDNLVREGHANGSGEQVQHCRQQTARDDQSAEFPPDAGTVENLIDNISEIEPNPPQVSAGGAHSEHDQAASTLDLFWGVDGSADTADASGPDRPETQIPEGADICKSSSDTDTRIAQAEAGSRPLENPNQQVAKNTSTGTRSISHADDIDRWNNQISHTYESGDPTRPDPARIRHDRITEPYLSRGQISTLLEDITKQIDQRSQDLEWSLTAQHRKSLNDVDSKNDQISSDIDLVARGREHGRPVEKSPINGQAGLKEQAGRDPRSSESPLEWIFSGWFNTLRR